MVMHLLMVKGNRILKITALIALGFSPLVSIARAQTAANTDAVAESYKKNCLMCHGPDGAGSALGKRLHTPDLRSKEIREKTSAVLAQSISAGKNNMPPFGTKLESDEIQKLVEYIRQFPDDTADQPK